MTLFEKFYNITSINIKSFYVDILDFFDNYHQDIVSYYTDYNTTYPTDAFNYYSSISQRLDIILSKISLYKENFETTDIWKIMEELDDFRIKLDAIESYPRLYRVNFIKKQNQDTEGSETHVLATHETLESLARDYNQNIDDLVILNNLREEDYTDKGGTKIILKNSISSAINNIEDEETVFDILIGKNVLGKDLPNYFEIDEESEDLTIMSPEKTFLQSTQNLFQLKKGEIPEYPDLGVAKDIFTEVAQSDVSYTFPIMLRQLISSLATDDTILNFEIIDIDIDKETQSVFVKCEVTNRLNDSLKFSTSL